MTVMACLGVLLLFLLFLLLLSRQKKMRETLEVIEHKLEHLQAISKLFPSFLQRSEDLTRNWADEMSLRQSALKNLIHEADQSLTKLDHLQRDIKQSQISKTTIEEILILINQGFDVEEIASRMNLPQGEVEVAVRLRQYLNNPMVEKL
jgi:DNA-binding NarL/FixJ family response regulator